MALQGIWSGTISFSLVAIPVQLVRAVAPGRISFRLLHGTDYSPLARRMSCPREEEMVPPEEIVRGYELAPDRYLPITDEELEAPHRRSAPLAYREEAAILALEPLNGWAIGQRLTQVSGDVLQVSDGSLYPALHKLEQEGWIAAEWRPSENNRRAKFYSLTRLGRRQLEREAANWTRLSAAISHVVRLREA